MSQIVRVEIDYNGFDNFSELIKSCKIDFFNKKIGPSNFEETSMNINETCEFQAICFNDYYDASCTIKKNIQDIFEIFKKEGMEPASLIDLLYYDKAMSDIKYPIFAFGSRGFINCRDDEGNNLIPEIILKKDHSIDMNEKELILLPMKNILTKNFLILFKKRI